MHQKYFHSYLTLYFIINKSNKQSICARIIFMLMIPYTSLERKVTSNKFMPEIFSFLWHLILAYKQTVTSNKYAKEIFSFLWYLIVHYQQSNKQ